MSYYFMLITPQDLCESILKMFGDKNQLMLEKTKNRDLCKKFKNRTFYIVQAFEGDVIDSINLSNEMPLREKSIEEFVEGDCSTHSEKHVKSNLENLLTVLQAIPFENEEDDNVKKSENALFKEELVEAFFRIAYDPQSEECAKINLENLIAFLQIILNETDIDSIQVLVHWYNGLINKEKIKIKDVSKISSSTDELHSVFRNMREDVLYDIS